MNIKKQIGIIQERFPDAVAYLNPPALIEDIKTLEEELELSLPEELQALYLHANGQENANGPGFFFDLNFLSLERVLEETKM